MEFCFDTETPENRVLSWLSQTDMPASIRNDCEEASATSIETNKSNCVPKKSVSKSVDCNVRQLPTRYQKSGLNKYFSCNYVNVGESATSDSECELHENCRSNRLYCDAERNSIIRYIVENKLFPFLKGNTIWKQMEKERICCRTWQSMKTQFHKYIYPHLKDFDIADSDRCYFAVSMTRNPLKKSAGFHTPGQRGWRKNCKFYTFIEDAIIIYYILEKDRYEFAYGNTLWQRMESKHIVPGRSWHSMKSRYKNFLSKYIERVNSATKNDKSPKKKLGPIEKTKLLQDFMVDHLNDIATTIGCITDSHKSLEELRGLGMDSLFSIPLPENDRHFTERETIKKCVLDIAQQLDEKFHVLIEYSNKTAKKCKEIMNVFSPQYSTISESFKWREQSFCLSDQNDDLSESVQQGLKISPPKKIVSSSSKKSIDKPCTIVNPEISVSTSLDSENVVLEEIVNLAEKLQAGIKDIPCPEENVRNSLLQNSSILKGDVYFSNTPRKTSVISQKSGNADEATTEILKCSEMVDENTLRNTLEEDNMTSDTARCEIRDPNGGKEIHRYNHSSSSMSIIHMPKSFSSANLFLASVQGDELKNLPKLTLASADHSFCNTKNKNTEETNKSCATLYKYSNRCDMTDISSIELRLSSATTLKNIFAPEIQEEPNNNKQSNLKINSFHCTTIQSEAKYSEARKEICSSEMHTSLVSLNIPGNIFTQKQLDIKVQSDLALCNTKYCTSEESKKCYSSRKSSSDSSDLVSINEFAVSSSAREGENSKELIVDDRCRRVESSVTVNSCKILARELQTNNNPTQSLDRSEEESELRLHLTDESEEELELKRHISENNSEEEPELRLHISEHLTDESEELELKRHISEDNSEEEPELRLHISEEESEGERGLK